MTTYCQKPPLQLTCLPPVKFPPLRPQTSQVAIFQLLSDICGDCYVAFANPSKVTGGDDETQPFKRYDPHWDKEKECGLLNPAWTVVVVNTTLDIGAWIGDWVVATALGETIEVEDAGSSVEECLQGGGNFPVWEITARLSDQSTYLGVLEDKLYSGQPVEVALGINGYTRSASAKPFYWLRRRNGIWRIEAEIPRVQDVLLPPGDSLPKDTPIFATYFATLRTFLVTGGPCYPEEMFQ